MEKRSHGPKLIFNNWEGLMKLIYNMFKEFVQVLEDERLARRLWISFKLIIEGG
jgi:hypothetical protein